ncbi:hypothetical protein SAMN05421767_10639 [Granulicatella balaenopterae]|uniref:Uncharacterized protein n=1 Tax=Granulicatella balaenopterae TaxID=137733 RepID=A0A1H9INB7_9LACT|nr:hypothetical protein [Granulicatella balaenopterae]SEQ76056.1 hypothetical protein SAMN05421767_10639 [Granulicatella balaenopterae]
MTYEDRLNIAKHEAHLLAIQLEGKYDLIKILQELIEKEKAKGDAANDKR